MADSITVTDLENAKLDVDHIADIATSNLDTATDRKNNTKNTMQGALKTLGYTPPTVYAGAISFTVNDNTKTVDESGVIYAPLPSALPFTTSGTFIGDDDARFFVIQQNDAATISYSGSESLLLTTEVQSAIDELALSGEARFREKKFFHSTDFLSDGWDVIVPEDGDYQAFPMLSQNAAGRILATWMHQTQHTGSMPANVESKYSDDAGATWSSTTIIYGTMVGAPDVGDINPFYQVAGVDSRGRFVVIFNKYASNPGGAPSQPWITRSLDGVAWDDPVKLTFSGDTIGLSDSIVPFGEIKLLPSGQLGLAIYQGTPSDNSYIGIIDDIVNPSDIDLRLIVAAPVNNYSEIAFTPLTNKIWFAFMRQDGAVNKIPYYVTEDSGATWATPGSMGDNGGVQTGGGWVVQVAERVTINNNPHIIVGVGARVSVSGPIDDAPAMIFFACPADHAINNTGLWRQIHDMPFANDGFDRDAYSSILIDDTSGECFVIAHEETAIDESKIETGRFNYREEAKKPVLNDISFNGVTVTYTDQVGRFTKIGNQVFGRIEINYTGLDTADISPISVVVSGFPYSVLNNGPCSVDVENSTGLTFSATDTAFAQFSASDAIVQVQKADGNAWGYSSGKISAAGSIILNVQYETGD